MENKSAGSSESDEVSEINGIQVEVKKKPSFLLKAISNKISPSNRSPKTKRRTNII